VICPNCSAENPKGSKFCSECGAPFSRSCPSCGSPIPSLAKFCNECGSAVAPVRSHTGDPARAVAPGAPAKTERRHVSVLFADLVGFTTLSESRDSEDVRELLSRYFEVCRTAIARYGGVVEKFIGDAVMAVWGTPVAQEDDAERSVRAALDLVDVVSELGRDAGVPDLRARVGVLTGEASVNLSASGEGMVAGDLVNTASRIQSVAGPGEVFVGEATKRSTEAVVAYEDAGARELKGKAEPVQLWRARRVVAGRRGGQRPTGFEAPFVGRDRELRLMKDLLHASAEDHRAHVVSVVGIAGIGKTRLSWEFEKYVDGLAQPIYWHQGRCVSYGEGVTYWALAEMVRRRLGIAEGEDTASAADKVRAAVEEHMADPEERRWVTPRLAHLLGLEDRAAPDTTDLFAAWRLFFERLAERRPTILVFEDMQWADPSLLEFIEYLLNWSRNHPLFVVSLARPELAERHPTWAAGKRNFTSLYLDPLPSGAMTELLAGLVPGLPEEIRDRILSRAEGVPLYAVETVRMLLDRGILTRDGASFRPTGPIESLEVPETLHALIAARLDGLAPEQRHVLQEASVLGKSFTASALAGAFARPQDDVDPLLASLVRKEVLTLVADPRSPERGQYTFLQDLLRMVAYETLAKKERRAKHLAVARFLETSWGEEAEIVEVVASHYLEALALAPNAEDAPQLRGKACELLERAGERAASLAAAADAERYFREASRLAEQGEVRGRLLERAGRMAFQAGRLDAATDHYVEAMSLFESSGKQHAAARLSAALAEVEYEKGHLEEPVARMEHAFALLHPLEPDETLATLASQLGKLHFFRGEMNLARERLDTALRIAEPLALPEVISQSLNTKGVVLLFEGRFEEGTGLLRHALEVALQNDRSAAALRAYTNLAETLHRRDRYDESLATYEEGLSLAARVGDSVWDLALTLESIFPLFVLGRWDDVVQRVAQVPEEDWPRADILSPLLVLPRIHVARGDVGAAQHVVSVFSRFQSSEDVQERSAFAVARAVVLSAEGKLEAALAAARDAVIEGRRIGPDSQMFKLGIVEALDISFALGDLGAVEEFRRYLAGLRPGETTLFLKALALRADARLAAGRDAGRDAAAADRSFRAAARVSRDMGAPLWLATTLAEHGEWMVSERRAEDAAPVLAEAKKLFEALGALPWLDAVSHHV
jgi:class 3 adenylate cyclase/tetratricopeptide (TPR) repeat protein